MIDTAIRSQGIGGSEVAALMGMDPRRDAFAVYAEKLGLVERAEPNARMKWGKRIERVIAEAYAEETKQDVRWLDETVPHPERSWQVMTPDALVWAKNPIGGLDAKNVALDQSYQWGETGTDVVPEHIAIQAHWYCSTSELPWWDIAALFGGNDLRIYRIHRNPEIEAVLLEAAEEFWTKHVLARNPPPIGGSETAAAYLRQKFPKNVVALRPAVETEVALLYDLKDIRQKFDKIAAEKKAIENEVKLVIADADGLLWGKEKVTYKLCKDTTGTDWEAVARELADTVAQEWLSDGGGDWQPFSRDLIDKTAVDHEIITKQGSRRLLVPRSWKKSDDEDE